MGLFRKKTPIDKVKNKTIKILKAGGIIKKSPLEKGIEKAKQKAEAKASAFMEDLIEDAMNAAVNVIRNKISDFWIHVTSEPPKVEIPYNSEQQNKISYNPTTSTEGKDEKKNSIKQILKDFGSQMVISSKKDELLYTSDLKKRNSYEAVAYIESDNEKKIAKQLLQEIGSTSAGIAINASKYSGLLQCNVDPSQLAKAADGSGMLRGFCCEGGRINQQALFKSISFSSQLLSVSTAFVVLSVVTQKYYLHQITEKLKRIEKGVEDIINILQEEDRAVIMQSMHTLQRLESYDSFRIMDLEEARSEQKNADKIRTKYHNLVNGINIQADNCFKNVNKARSIYDKFNDSQYKTRMQIAFGAEMLYFAYGVLIARIYSILEGEDSSRAKHATLSLDSNFGRSYTKKHHEIKESVVQALCALDWENSTFGREKIRNMYSTVADDFKQIEEMFQKGQEGLQPVICYEFENGEPIRKGL